tara:strand:- start:10 stop:651 length:642 start_codon:yes stop_codon:yes gene_type:complete
MTFDDIFKYYSGRGFTSPVNAIAQVQEINQPNGIMNTAPIITQDQGGESNTVNENTTGNPGGPGIGGLFNSYQNLGTMGKLGTTMALNAVLPGVGSLLGLAGLGNNAYNNSGFLDGLNTTGFGNFTGGLFGAPQGTDQYGNSMNVADVESGLENTNTNVGFTHDMSESSTTGGGDNSNASDPGGSDSMGSFANGGRVNYLQGGIVDILRSYYA